MANSEANQINKNNKENTELHYKECCQKIGEFMIKFSQIEGGIADILEYTLSIDKFEGLILGKKIDFAALCDITKTLFKNKFPDIYKKDPRLGQAIKGALKINEMRNNIAHAIWLPDNETKLLNFYMRPRNNDLRYWEYPVFIEKIQEAIEEAKNIHEIISAFVMVFRKLPPIEKNS